ncbi:MAG: hypothetical protein Q4A12_02435 [Eubacteriales bacterium]|nr:hypothetical protein [Eubacteriales bacterium]
MRRKVVVFIVTLTVLLINSCINTYAQDISELEKSVDDLKSSLSKEVQEDLDSLGASASDISSMSEISFDSVMSLIFSKLSNESKGPLSSSAIVIAVLIITALMDSYKDALKQSSMNEVINVVSTLCITTAIVLPVIDLISDCIATVTDAADFMLLYVPIMVAIVTFSGNPVSGASYYSFMVLACQGVSQISTKLISPLLNIYLGFTVSSSLTDRVNLRGFCNMFSKVIKWLIAFLMTVFSALMTIRGMITTAYDSVTARAVRFTMSSFVPIVGAALSESYKTIQGSINLLRTGAGVFVIIAICVVFLPVVLRSLVWLLSINFCKSIGEVLGVTTPINMLDTVSSVISTVFAITVCVMAVFVISTALLITLGGGAQ